MADLPGCTICLQDIVVGTEQVHMLVCGHAFHEECVLAFADSEDADVSELRCPVCRLCPEEARAKAVEFAKEAMHSTTSTQDPLQDTIEDPIEDMSGFEDTISIDDDDDAAVHTSVPDVAPTPKAAPKAAQKAAPKAAQKAAPKRRSAKAAPALITPLPGSAVYSLLVAPDLAVHTSVPDVAAQRSPQEVPNPPNSPSPCPKPKGKAKATQKQSRLRLAPKAAPKAVPNAAPKAVPAPMSKAAPEPTPKAVPAQTQKAAPAVRTSAPDVAAPTAPAVHTSAPDVAAPSAASPMARAGRGPLETRPLFPSEFESKMLKAWCTTCASEASVMKSKSKLWGKQAARFQCSKCERVDLVLRRKYNTVQFVRDLDPEVQKKFYNDCGTMSADKIRESAQRTYKSYNREEEWFDEGGDYLPLSVWASRGWDIERIEQNTKPEDVRETAQGGRTYRVKIQSGGTRGARGKIDTNELMGQSRKRKKPQDATEALDDDGEQKPKIPPPRLDSDASDSDDSSSTSSDDSGDKKKKQKKKDKKLQMKKKRKKKSCAKSLRGSSARRIRTRSRSSKKSSTKRLTRRRPRKQRRSSRRSRLRRRRTPKNSV